MKANETFVSADEAALRLGVPTAWLKREAKAKRVPCLEVGRRLLFNVAAVEKNLLDRAEESIIGDPVAIAFRRLMKRMQPNITAVDRVRQARNDLKVFKDRNDESGPTYGPTDPTDQEPPSGGRAV